MEQMPRNIIYLVVFFLSSLLLVEFTDFSGMKSMAIVAMILLLINGFGGFRQIPHHPKNLANLFKRRIIRRKVKLRKGRV